MRRIAFGISLVPYPPLFVECSTSHSQVLIQRFSADAKFPGKLRLRFTGGCATAQLGSPIRCERLLAASVGSALLGERNAFMRQFYRPTD